MELEMIILDNYLTKRRIKNGYQAILETMESYKTYKHSLDLARQLKNMIGENDTIRQNLFNFDSIQSSSAHKYLKGIGREDISIFLRREVPYTDNDMNLFKTLVNAEVYRVQKRNIKNIAFAGGGAKCMSYPGVYRALQEQGIEPERIAGASGGAIGGLLVALDYTPRKIEELMLKYDYTKFFYESNINNPILKDTLMQDMMHQSAYLNEYKKTLDANLLNYFVKNPENFKKFGIHYEKDSNISSELEEHLLIEYYYETEFLKIQDAKNVVYDAEIRELIDKAHEKSLDTYVKSLKSEKDREFAEELIEGMNLKDNYRHINRYQEFLRLKRGEDLIEEFFGDVVEMRLKYIDKNILEGVSEGLSSKERMRAITFVEYKKLREVLQDNPRFNFKDLAICICEKISSNPLKTFNKDNYKQIDVYAEHEDPLYANMPMKTATRISMNLPGAFSSYEYNGKKYVDGGVRANFPMHFFDKTLGLDKRTTIGVCLAPAENYARTDDAGKILNPDRRSVVSQNNLLKRAVIHINNYFSDVMTQIHGNKLDNNKPLDFFDLTRIGVINVLDIDTTEFNLSQKVKAKLFKQGYFATHDLLKDDYNAQLRHFVERMKVLHSKVAVDLELLNGISQKSRQKISEELFSDADFKAIGNTIAAMQDNIEYKMGEKINKRNIRPNI